MTLRSSETSTKSLGMLTRQFTWQQTFISPARCDSGSLQELVDREKRDFIVYMETPHWVKLLLTATGISELSLKIERERERREDTLFLHPFPLVHEVVTSLSFDLAVSAIVLANLVKIGWEASAEEGMAVPGSIAEHFFVLCFLVEWCLRVLAFGWVWVFEALNLCDTALIFFTGILPKWGLEPLGMDIAPYRMCTTLRVLRLLRVVHSMRTLPFFKELWTLILGVMNSLRPMLWTILIGLTILYVFAVIATELVAQREFFEEHDHAQQFFGDVLRSMFSLFQIMTLNNWGNHVVRPLMVQDGALLGAFFVSYIALGVFVFWNLITATIVENAVKTGRLDVAHHLKQSEEQRVREYKAFVEFFLEIDEDGSGEISIDEFLNAVAQNRSLAGMVTLLGFKISDLQDLWDLLDDGDGVLSIKEFATGIRRVQGRAKNKDVLDVDRKLRHTRLSEAELRAQVEQFGASLALMESNVRALAQDTGEIVGLFAEMYHRLQFAIDSAASQEKLAAATRAADKRKGPEAILANEIREEDEASEEDEEEEEEGEDV